MRFSVALALVALLASPAFAEDPPAAPEATKGTASRDAAPAADAPKEVDAKALLGALELPKAADRAREAGIPVDDVAEALGVSRDQGARAEETAAVLEEAGAAAEEHGPTDNFGAFVQAQLDEGKRGQDLAAAIRAEHQANGKGKPDHAGPPEGKGKPDDAGSGGKKPADAGAPEGKGKPDDAGGASRGSGASGKAEGAGSRGGPPAGKGKPDGKGK